MGLARVFNPNIDAERNVFSDRDSSARSSTVQRGRNVRPRTNLKYAKTPATTTANACTTLAAAEIASAIRRIAVDAEQRCHNASRQCGRIAACTGPPHRRASYKVRNDGLPTLVFAGKYGVRRRKACVVACWWMGYWDERSDRPGRPRRGALGAHAMGGVGTQRVLNNQTLTSRCRSAAAGRQVRARESSAGARHAATDTRVALLPHPRLPAPQRVRP